MSFLGLAQKNCLENARQRPNNYQATEQRADTRWLSGFFSKRQWSCQTSGEEAREPCLAAFSGRSNSLRIFSLKEIRGLIPATWTVSRELVCLESAAAVSKLISDLQATQSWAGGKQLGILMSVCQECTSMFEGTFFAGCHFAGKEKERARQILAVSGGLMKAWQGSEAQYLFSR